VHPQACNGCIFDPSDIPFTYFSDFNTPQSQYYGTIKDYGDLQNDIAAGSLPSFSYVKARLFHNEHPNYSTIADGIAFVQSTVQLVEQSSYASSTLVLLTWDEGGGFFDHVPPPAPVPTTADQDASGKPTPYGTRVPLLAIGPFTRKGAVSHVQMEHSSIVRFLEYNFLGPVGQLKARDAVVNNMGSLLDPAATGITIPEK
jgi:phospholipase C